MKKLILIAIAMALGMQAMAAGERFSYRGKLAKPDGSDFDASVTMDMTFNLYDTPEVSETYTITVNLRIGKHEFHFTRAIKPYWGRKMPVRIEADGSFCVELSDDAGSPVADARYSELKDALKAASRLYVGLTPGSSTELLPRQPINVTPRALTASVARKIETVRAPSIAAQSISMHGAASVASLTVSGNVVQNGGTTTLVVPADTVQDTSATTEIKVTRSIKGINAYSYPSIGTPGRPTTDMFLIRKTDVGWHSLIFPLGAQRPNGSGSLETVVTFGKE